MHSSNVKCRQTCLCRSDKDALDTLAIFYYRGGYGYKKI